MTSVEQGMDTARARVVANQLKHEGSALAALGAQGSAMMGVLEDVWGGPDAEKFSREWQAARPSIARSSQALTESGHELTRQAEEQDTASGGDGGAGTGIGGIRAELPPHHGWETGAPNLPPMFPEFRDPDPEGAWNTLKDLWELSNHPLAELWKIAFDETLGELLDELGKLGGKFKILGVAGKVFGGLGGLWSYITGYTNMGQAVYRLFTEGPSVDGALQFLQGAFGAASGSLAIAAAALGLTGVGGLPAIIVGGGALLCGLISLGIGEVREYWPWFKQTIEEDPSWAAKISQQGGLYHGWELPERNAPVPPPYRKSDLAGFMGVPVGA